MSAKGAVVELARQVRGDTLLFLEMADERSLLWAPPGTSNHIVWHAGHALWVQDVLFVEIVTKNSELPPGWADTFGMNCRPVKETREWPSRGELQERLVAQLNRIVELVSRVDDEMLAPDAPPLMDERNLLSALTHGWHDEAKHTGEMFLLFKMARANMAGHAVCTKA